MRQGVSLAALSLRSMQDPEFEVPRMHLLQASVNKERRCSYNRRSTSPYPRYARSASAAAGVGCAIMVTPHDRRTRRVLVIYSFGGLNVEAFPFVGGELYPTFSWTTAPEI